MPKLHRWAFAVLLFEIFTMGQSPYHGKSIANVITFVTSGKVMSRTREIPSKIYSIMTDCWKQDPEKRPVFAELVLTLSVVIGQAAHEVYWSNCKYKKRTPK